MSKPGGSKADTAVKLVLIFFISLLSFTVGTLVGGQFEKSKSYQMTLETEGGAEAAEVAANEHAENAASPISEEDIEGLEDFVKNGEKEGGARDVASAEGEHAEEAPAHGAKAEHGAAAEHGAKAEKGHEAAAPAHAKKEDGYTHASQIRPAVESATKSAAATLKGSTAPTAKTAEAPAKAAERLAMDKAPTADVKKAPRQPSGALPAVATSVVGKYTVQVASYATEGEARSHATRLHDKGFNAFYIPADVSGKTWYRVSIGRFDDQKTAMAHRKEVLDAQAATSAIVQKILK
ncbi:MAG: SPOR domain-containing protein [Bdellovibrionota bacterium]